jgi:hypothetical protein
MNNSKWQVDKFNPSMVMMNLPQYFSMGNRTKLYQKENLMRVSFPYYDGLLRMLIVEDQLVWAGVPFREQFCRIRLLKTFAKYYKKLAICSG